MNTGVSVNRRRRVGRPSMGPRQLIMVRVPLDIHRALRREKLVTGKTVNDLINERLLGMSTGMPTVNTINV